MHITIRVASIYGRETIYPACEKARLFADLAGTKTLTRDALNLIHALGYEIKQEYQAFHMDASSKRSTMQ